MAELIATRPNTVLSPCLVDGEVRLVEIDLDACPRPLRTATCGGRAPRGEEARCPDSRRSGR